MAEQSPLNWHLRIAALEKRVSQLESGQQDLNRAIDPDGWIGQAFEVEQAHNDEQFARLHSELANLNGKLDTILRHLTGMQDEQ
ncbi:MAG: hypothetical protein AAFY57_19515 [Cyanobacteria bacterium J06642_2]